MTFPVEIVLKGRDSAVTESLTITHGEAAGWNDEAARDALVAILRAIDRAEHPGSDPNRAVMLRGFSWIVEPSGGGVVIAIEIPMGAAVAGPFAIEQAKLDAMITRVLRLSASPEGTPTVH
jgi:hypothetical protein